MTGEEPTTEVQPSEPRRFLRSRSDRMIAGVAGGLGEYFGVDAVIVRIAFAISVFFGGLGALAYLAIVLFVPSEPGDGSETPRPPIERSRGLAIGAGIGLGVIALSWGVFDGPLWDDGFFLGVGPVLFVLAVVAVAILISRRGGGSSRAGSTAAGIALGFVALVGLSLIAVAAAWFAATGNGVAVAIAIVAIGAMLVVSALTGAGARWLIAPAVALAVPLGLVSAADISFGDGVGEREYRPLSVSSLPDEYELGIGRLAVDLRDLDWSEHTVVDLNVDLGIGQAVVAVPSDVCVTTDVKARAGVLRIAGDEIDGIDVDGVTNLGATTTPRLNLTGEVDLGELRVVNDDEVELDAHDHHFGFNDQWEDDATMRNALTAACEEPAAPAARGG